MAPLRRFYTIMAWVFLAGAAISLWRILACGGARIWYVPCVLAVAAGLMALSARNCRRKESRNSEEL